MPARVTVDTRQFHEDLEKAREAKDARMQAIFHRVGGRTVQLHRSFTAQLRKDGRRKHPGGWADRTGTLADSYDYQVDRDTGVWRLVFFNTARHAHLIEARDGLFVVRGTADPGGPIQQAFQQAVREMAPEWEIAP